MQTKSHGPFYNAWHHLCTINHHKWLVMKYCFRVGLYKQGLLHDLSKYSWEEFRIGVKYYQGNRSPHAGARDAEGFSTGWFHHKGRNKHHHEYWIDIKSGMDGTLVGHPMPTRYIVEMFCDRIAASKVYMKEKYTDRSALQYYEFTKPFVLMHEDSDAFLHKLLLMLAEQGEDETLRWVKENVVKARYRIGERGKY